MPISVVLDRAATIVAATMSSAQERTEFVRSMADAQTLDDVEPRYRDMMVAALRHLRLDPPVGP